MPQSGRRIGILSGGGSIPREIADSVAARRAPVFIVGIEGEADPASLAPHPVELANWGQIGRMVSLFRKNGVTDIVIVGRVSRPDLGKVRPDLGLVLALPMIWRIVRAGGDDAVLREVIRYFEGQGFRVVGPADVAPEIVIGAGPLGAVRSDNVEDRRDIALGLEVIARLGPLDIGQGVVVAGGRIEAIEGVEGTDRMLERVAALRRARAADAAGGRRGGAGGVLIKRPKPGQELRIDLPAIGPATVTRVAEAGLRGIAVLAGRTIAAERGELVRRADGLGIFVVGTPETDLPPQSMDAAPAPLFTLLGGPRPSAATITSAMKGARVVSTLARYGVGTAAVVVRRHVLAVEAGEGSLALLGRVGALRQWGEGKGKGGRRGVAVLREGTEISARTVEAVAHAGLAGLVIAASARRAIDPPAEAMGAAARLSLFVAHAGLSDEEAAHGEGP